MSADPAPDPVLSFGYSVKGSRQVWKDNAEMFADVAKLGRLDGNVLDLTYSVGQFWRHYRPEHLTTNDPDPRKDAQHRFSVLEPPPAFWIGKFDSVVFDPPYAMSGRRDAVPGKGDGDFSRNFGLDYDSIKDTDVPPLIEAGVEFAAHCRTPKGYVLVKCQDQQWRGKLFEQTDLIRRTARRFDLRVVEMYHLPIRVRAQRSQKHARNNYSTLVVLGR